MKKNKILIFLLFITFFNLKIYSFSDDIVNYNNLQLNNTSYISYIKNFFIEIKEKFNLLNIKIQEVSTKIQENLNSNNENNDHEKKEIINKEENLNNPIKEEDNYYNKFKSSIKLQYYYFKYKLGLGKEDFKIKKIEEKIKTNQIKDENLTSNDNKNKNNTQIDDYNNDLNKKNQNKELKNIQEINFFDKYFIISASATFLVLLRTCFLIYNDLKINKKINKKVNKNKNLLIKKYNK